MRKFWVVLLALLLWGCGGYPDDLEIGEEGIDEPDRILYLRALHDLRRGKNIQARLELNALINTYPDSEFLPQAKYATAESFYRDGGRSDMVQAEAEFKDYITFFPTSDLSDDAQLMIAMTHLRQMEKPDRDPTQSLMAELELKNFISTYPDSNLLDEAKAKLRAVQEVLAEGILKVANFYSTIRSNAAAIDRYRQVLEDYPDFTKTPDALFRMAETMRRSDNEGESIIYYARIVRDHPLSERVGEAKERLISLNQPIPEVNSAALARAEEAPQPEGRGLFGRMFGILGRRPDISTETTAASIIRESEEGEGTGEGTFEVEGRVISGSSPPGGNL
jgi:outer membrane protein assembly factor BamD